MFPVYEYVTAVYQLNYNSVNIPSKDSNFNGICDKNKFVRRKNNIKTAVANTKVVSASPSLALKFFLIK